MKDNQGYEMEKRGWGDTPENRKWKDEQDNLGKDAVKRLWIKNVSSKPNVYDFSITNTTDEFDHSDVNVDYVSGTTKVMQTIEVKHRNYTSTQYDSAMIEIAKYNELMLKWRNEDRQPLYVTYWSDGVADVFDLSRTDVREAMAKASITRDRTTYKASYRKTEPCYLIPLNKAKRFHI